jgi:hypothetical protein
MGVLEPSGNGLYLLPHQPELPSSPSAEKACDPSSRVALNAQCDHVLWHRRFGHLNMQSLRPQHTHGVPTSPALATSVKYVSCDSCLLHKTTAAPRNTVACAKISRPLLDICPLTFGVELVSPPHRASATAYSSSTTIPITCGCGFSSQRTTHALSGKPSCWTSNTCMHANTPNKTLSHRS